MNRSLLILLFTACGTPAATPTDGDAPTATPAAPPPLSWSSHRDTAGRFIIDVPSEFQNEGRSTRTIDHRTVQLYRSVAELEDPPVDVEVSWALLPRPPTLPLPDSDDTDSDVPTLSVPADAPMIEFLPVFAKAMGAETTLSSTRDTHPMLSWTGHNFSKQWSGAVVLGPDRLYLVRVRNSGKLRLEEAHIRVLETFHPLDSASLTDQEVGATKARVDEEDAQDLKIAQVAAANAKAESDKAEAIARGERPTDEALIAEAVHRQLVLLRCFDFNNEAANNLTMRVRVKDGEGQAVTLLKSPLSFSNNQPAPKPVTGSLASCIKRRVAEMSFPSGVEGTAEIPFMMGQSGF